MEGKGGKGNDVGGEEGRPRLEKCLGRDLRKLDPGEINGGRVISRKTEGKSGVTKGEAYGQALGRLRQKHDLSGKFQKEQREPVKKERSFR